MKPKSLKISVISQYAFHTIIIDRIDIPPSVAGHCLRWQINENEGIERLTVMLLHCRLPLCLVIPGPELAYYFSACSSLPILSISPLFSPLVQRLPSIFALKLSSRNMSTLRMRTVQTVELHPKSEVRRGK